MISLKSMSCFQDFSTAVTTVNVKLNVSFNRDVKLIVPLTYER